MSVLEQTLALSATVDRNVTFILMSKFLKYSLLERRQSREYHFHKKHSLPLSASAGALMVRDSRLCCECLVPWAGLRQVNNSGLARAALGKTGPAQTLVIRVSSAVTGV